MKKILLLLSLLLVLGCTSLEVGQSFTRGTKTYTKVTESHVLKISDSVNLQNYYEHRSTHRGSTLKMANLDMTARYYEDGGDFLLYFPLFGKSDVSGPDDMFLRNVLFSNGQQTVSIDIKDFSRIDINYQTKQAVSPSEREKLFEIFNSDLPVTMRVMTNSRIFDVPFDDTFRAGVSDILKISII